ncbi:hypothetical protein ACWCRD_01190 [Streptomyces sp. NPDC002092]
MSSWPWSRASAGGWGPAGIVVGLLTVPGYYDIALRYRTEWEQ